MMLKMEKPGKTGKNTIKDMLEGPFGILKEEYLIEKEKSRWNE